MNQFSDPVSDLQDAALTRALQQCLDTKTKPQGSLGRMEALALQIGQIGRAHV